MEQTAVPKRWRWKKCDRGRTEKGEEKKMKVQITCDVQKLKKKKSLQLLSEMSSINLFLKSGN